MQRSKALIEMGLHAHYSVLRATNCLIPIDVVWHIQHLLLALQADSSKWQEAKEDEMKSINTNDVWDLEEIPNGAKIVGCNRSTRQRWLQREYRKISMREYGKL
jgi:hypothetical protein